MAEKFLTIAANGQITLSKDILQHLGVHSGAEIIIEKLPNGAVQIRTKRGKISDVFGMLKRPGQAPVTIEEIKRATEDAWAGKRVVKKRLRA